LLENLVGQPSSRPQLVEYESKEATVKTVQHKMPLSQEKPEPRRAQTEFGGRFSPRSTLDYMPQFAYYEPALFPASQRVADQSAASFTTALNLDCMTFSASPVHSQHARSGGSKSDWDQLFSASDDRKHAIHESTAGNSRRQPPSLGGYSSLASSSPRGLNSTNGIDAAATLGIFAAQSCPPTEPWSPESDFSINSPYYPRQRGGTHAFNDNYDLRLSSDPNAIAPAELADSEFIHMAAAPNQIPSPATGTLGDVELFGVDLSLVI
jgi:hypothetical protein